MALAQNDAAIEQARLYRDTARPVSLGVDANANALPTDDSAATEDDSMGAQLILKNQERPRFWTLSGGVSLLYTDNVALTRDDTKDDFFAVIDASLGWAAPIASNVEGNFGLHLGTFRYADTSGLDFESIGAGGGIVWTPPSLPGFALFARYDFTELLNTSFNQILMDHTVTLGVQRTVLFGRAHGLTIGALGMAGLSDPSESQRSQLAAFADYRLQLSRKLQADLLLRPAVHFYTETGRKDFNQIITLNLRYSFNEAAELTGFLSYGLNRSDRARFDYNAFTTGAGLALRVRF